MQGPVGLEDKIKKCHHRQPEEEMRQNPLPGNPVDKPDIHMH
jgi:hypothetical protein